MHPFSIDYITRESQRGVRYGQQPNEVTSDDDRTRRSMSPPDSGMSSDNSPYAETDDQKYSDERYSIAGALLTLDKKAGGLVPSSNVNGNKPTHSYIALISMAILSSSDKKMLLGDIYQYIMDNYSYYNNGDKAWRNSIRHNLSLNECFIKNGRADNGKGNYWSIHPACIRDFSKGDFRRRQARRRARKTIREPSANSLGLPYGSSVGYVPMTASNTSYLPYATGSPPFFYPPCTVAPLPISAHAHSSASPAVLASPTMSPSLYTTERVTPPVLYASNGGPTQSSPFSTLSATAVQGFFADETRLAIAKQAFAPQHLQPNFQFQKNW